MIETHRDWNSLVPRIKSNVAFLTIAGIGIGSLLYSQILGTSLIIVGVAIFLYQIVPPKLNKAESMVGIVVDLQEIDNIYPRLIKLGICGRANSGKSTLRNYFTQTTGETSVTQSLSLRIIGNAKNSKKYFGLLDGPGNDFSAQFNIVRNSDVLIIVLDHNYLDNDMNFDRTRLQDLSTFNNQLRSELLSSNKKMKKIILLLNKKDLWIDLFTDESEILTTWFKEEVKRWEESNLSHVVKSLYHSNFITQDCLALQELIETI